MEDALKGHVNVDDFRELLADQGQEDTFHGVSHVAIFLWGFPNNDGLVDRILAVGHAGHMENGIVIGERIKAGVVPKRTFQSEFAKVDISFQNEFCTGWDFQLDGFARHHFHRFAAQKARKHHFVDIVRERHDTRKDHCRISSNSHGDLHPAFFFRPSAHAPGLSEVLGAVLVCLPVHGSCGLVEDLHSIHAAVALSGFRILAKNQRQSDEASSILGPALKDGKFQQ